MGNLATDAREISLASTDEELLSLAERFRDDDGQDVDAVAQLTIALAASGDIVAFSDKAVDIASTGGPSSLTTLLCPLILVSAGSDVPKVTVPGRPAGGIDVLATIHGYQTRLGIERMRECIASAHYAHVEATDQWAPLDGRLFRLRQKSGLQKVPSLVVASILSKKRAVGLRKAAVEIRRGPFGNLGNDPESLQRAATLFRDVAAAVDIECSTEVTGDGSPYQPYIGRGEALTALQLIFDGAAVDALRDHFDLCHELAARALGRRIAFPEPNELRDAFSKNLSCQGSSYAAFLKRVKATSDAPKAEIYAESSGELSWDLGIIRDILVKSQSDDDRDSAGVQLLSLKGNVTSGEPIARVRGDSNVLSGLAAAYTVKETR